MPFRQSLIFCLLLHTSPLLALPCTLWSRSPHDLVSCQGPPSPPLSLARCHCFAVTLDLRNTTCIATSQGACMERIHIRVIPGSF
ncbi:uncharacterized protein SETTUDRAFT_164161, partial [Exserohilum turcica Et28A]